MVGRFGDLPTESMWRLLGKRCGVKTYDEPLKDMPFGNTKPGHRILDGIIVWRKNRPVQASFVTSLFKIVFVIFFNSRSTNKFIESSS